jgi:hypothetical protein
MARAVGGVDLAADPLAWLTGPAGDWRIALDAGEPVGLVGTAVADRAGLELDHLRAPWLCQGARLTRPWSGLGPSVCAAPDGAGASVADGG